MDLPFLKALALTGGDWVIWGLLLCSVVAVAALIERGMLLRRERLSFEAMRRDILSGLSGELSALEKSVKRHDGAASRILASALGQAERGAESVSDVLAAAGLEERERLERRLLILGTLGNNAPFIGLFGTVLGVIRAFHDLASTGAGPEVVMVGLSEALIATAVGLFVAIPCVIGYNYYQKEVRDLLSGTEALGRVLLARLRPARR